MAEERDGRVSRSEEVLENLEMILRAEAPKWGDYLVTAVKRTMADQGFAPNSPLVESVTATPANDNEQGFYIRFGPSVPYALWVAKGRRPGARPIPSEALMGWVQAKGMVDTDEDPRQVAYLVSRSIVRKGIQPRPFLQDTMLAVMDQLKAMLKRDITEAADKAAKKV